MVLDFDIGNILKQKELATIEHHVAQAAAELAVFGEVDIARKLVDLYFSDTQNLTAWYRVSLNGLNYAWNLRDEWPEHIPEDQKGEEILNDIKKRYDSRWPSDIPEESRTIDNKGLKAILKHVGDDGPPDASLTRWATEDKKAHLVKALDLSMRGIAGKLENTAVLNQDDDHSIKIEHLDTASSDLIHRIAELWDAKQIAFLSEAEYLWPYYMRGLWASAFKLTSREIKSKGEATLNAFTHRLTAGRASSGLKDKSTKELLTIANENTLRGPGSVYWKESGRDAPETMFQSPASPEQVMQLEARLATALPEDYKCFLLQSNGFISGPENLSDGIFNGYYPEAALYPAEKVSWVSNPYFELPIELLEISGAIESLAPTDGPKKSSDGSLEWSTPLPLFTRVLEIGTRDIDNLWLVEPELVRHARDVYKQMYGCAREEKQKKQIERAVREFVGTWEQFDKLEWCCVKWSAGGSACLSAYAGFRKYLEEVVEDRI
jgi:hypothetical protein